MGAVKRCEDRNFPIRPDSWYLVVYFDGGLGHISIPSSGRGDLERLLHLILGFELSGIPYRVFGVAREGIFELGHRFLERLEGELGVDLREKAERDVENLLDELRRMEEFYTRLGFLEDLEEIAEMRESYGEYLKRLKELKGKTTKISQNTGTKGTQ